jgi:hypothetical protein
MSGVWKITFERCRNSEKSFLNTFLHKQYTVLWNYIVPQAVLVFQEMVSEVTEWSIVLWFPWKILRSPVTILCLWDQKKLTLHRLFSVKSHMRVYDFILSRWSASTSICEYFLESGWFVGKEQCFRTLSLLQCLLRHGSNMQRNLIL